MESNFTLLRFYFYKGFQCCEEFLDKWDAKFFATNCGIGGNCEVVDNNIIIHGYQLTSSGADRLNFELHDYCNKFDVEIVKNKNLVEIKHI